MFDIYLGTVLLEQVSGTFEDAYVAAVGWWDGFPHERVGGRGIFPAGDGELRVEEGGNVVLVINHVTHER